MPLGSEKLGLLFPSSESNISWLREAEGGKEKLARIGKNLEGGIITEVTSLRAVYIPLGCIHWFETKQGGFMITIDFISPSSAKTYSALLSAGLDCVNGRSHQKLYFDRFLLSIGLSLDNNCVMLGIESWVNSWDRVKDWAGANPGWLKRATKIWAEFLQTSESQNILCPCGKMESEESFREHFRLSHIFPNSNRSIQTRSM